MTDDYGDEFEYDVALSFAGEDRAVADDFASLLKAKKIKVFYDEYEAADLWGKDLVDHLVNIYGKKARYCVMFISQYYPLKKWTKVERMAAQERALRDANEYILPLRLDDTQVPGITETTGYRDLREHPLESIANLLEQKLVRSKSISGSLPQSHDLKSSSATSANTRFGAIPMPPKKTTFTQYEKDNFARESITYIKQYFQEGLRQLEASNSNIQTGFDDMNTLEFMSRIYLHGEIRNQCRIWLGDSFGMNSICYNEGVHRLNTNSISESIAVADSGEELRLQIGYLGTGASFEGERMATQLDAAQHLWKRFIAPLERR